MKSNTVLQLAIHKNWMKSISVDTMPEVDTMPPFICILSCTSISMRSTLPLIIINVKCVWMSETDMNVSYLKLHVHVPLTSRQYSKGKMWKQKINKNKWLWKIARKKPQCEPLCVCVIEVLPFLFGSVFIALQPICCPLKA